MRLAGILISLGSVGACSVACSTGVDPPQRSEWTETGDWQPTGQPQISPDGRRLAVVGNPRGGSGSQIGEQRLILAGSHAKALTPADQAIRSFAWRPDSSTIVVAFSQRGDLDGPTLLEEVTVDGSIRPLPVPSRRFESVGRVSILASGSALMVPARPIGQRIGGRWLLRVDLVSGATSEVIPLSNSESIGYAVQIDGETILATVVADPTVSRDAALVRIDLRSGQRTAVSGRGQAVGGFQLIENGSWCVYSTLTEGTRDEMALMYRPLSRAGTPGSLGAVGPYSSVDPSGEFVVWVGVDGPGSDSRLMVRSLSGAPWL